MTVKNGVNGHAYPDKTAQRKKLSTEERLAQLEAEQTVAEMKLDEVIAEMKKLRSSCASKQALKAATKHVQEAKQELRLALDTASNE